MGDRYGVKEVFRTVQGEGMNAGCPALFVRFTGCNLWNGHHLHRESGAGPCALWCDTDFLKGVALSAEDIVGMMQEAWPAEPSHTFRWAVLTGGEPMLQVDLPLLEAMDSLGWRIAVETNGTVASPAFAAVDHVCLSPKRGTSYWELGVEPHEVKVVLPGAAPMQQGWTDEELDELEARWPRASFFAQPQDPVLPGPDIQSLLKGTAADGDGQILQAYYDRALERCLAQVYRRPGWRLSAQVHKSLGLR